MSNHTHEEDDMDRRQQARRDLLRSVPTPGTSRLAREQREGRPQPRPDAAPPEPEKVSFADYRERIRASRAEHEARRRRATAATASNERLFNTLRDNEGLDYAERWMSGGDDAA